MVIVYASFQPHGRVRAVVHGILALGLLSLCTACTTPEGAGNRSQLGQDEAKPVSGGVFRVVLEKPSSLDPVLSDSVYEAFPVNQIFDGLVEVDPSLKVVPGLADTWTITGNGTIYRFHLRNGVRFHDGTLLTAADVEYTIRRLLRPDKEAFSLARSYAMAIAGADRYSSGATQELAGIRVVDDHNIEIELLYPSTYFLQVLSMDGLKIVSSQALEEMGEERYGLEPVGTGPFRFAGWYEDHLEFEANKDYFRGSPYLERFHIRFLGPEDQLDSGARSFLAGELTMIQPDTESIPTLAQARGVQLNSYQELGLAFLGLGTSLPPLDRLEVRQAIAHAVNRQALVEDSPNVRRRAAGLVPPGMSAYSPDLKALEYDPEKARELLRSIGYDEGNPLPPITLLNVSKNVSVRRTVDRLQNNLAEIGIRMVVQQVSWAELNESIESNQAPLFLLAWIADLPEPDVFLRGLFAPGGPDNYFAFDDEEVSNLLEQGVRERNPMERIRIYRELDRRILSRAPVVPLYHTIGVVAFQKHVRGFAPGPLGISTVPLEKVWFSNGADR
jgi:oligopeptide transport system substrate-binding protein